jgi:hypothetical protein
MSTDPQDVAPETIGDSFDLLVRNTLRKTGPQLLLAVWFWGFTVWRRQAAAYEFHRVVLIPFAAGLAFVRLVFKRSIMALPRGSLAPLPVLMLAYSIWLGLWIPVQRRDIREWLGWVAMAAGLLACLSVAVPVLERGS